MSLLEQVAGDSATDPSFDHDKCKDLLQRIDDRLHTAQEVWQAFLDNAPEDGDRFTAVLWLGAERSKRLHALHLEVKAIAGELTSLTLDGAVESIGPGLFRCPTG